MNVTDSLRFEGARLPLEGLVRSLTADVQPALKYLSRMPPADVRIPKLAAEWNALVANMQKYDKGDGSSTVSGLRRYLVGDFGVRDLESCASAARLADTTKASPDPFTRRRRMFRAALVARCGTGGAEAVASYQKLRTLFQTRIAGRYPFVDTTRTLAGDVDPVILRDFLIQYDAFMAIGDVSLRSDAATAAAAKDALAFIAAMQSVRAFFAPLVDAPDKAPVQYLVEVPALDSATSRTLTVGSKAMPLDVEAHSATWTFGDPVRVTERDSLGRARPVFVATSSWGVVGLSKQGGVRLFHPATRVELTWPSTFPSTAPDIVLPKAPGAK